MTDTELLDALERFINNNGGLVIHNHGYNIASYPGLGIKCTGRSLRRALQQSMSGIDPANGAATADKTSVEAKEK